MERRTKKHALTALFLALMNANLPRSFTVGKHGKKQKGYSFLDIPWSETLDKVRSETRTIFEDLLVERINL